MAQRALDGLRVIECGDRAAASYAGKLMADLGADVVKVEPPARGHSIRQRGPFPGGKPDPEASGLFLYLNCNKQGVTLDLQQPRGQELLSRLAADADVLLHDFPPAQAEAAAVSYDRLARDNSRLVMASISPFGLSGPYRDYKAYELTTASAGGWTWLNGWPGHPDMPPLKPFGLQTQYQAGVTAALAVMGALFWRETSGRGQHVEVSEQECIVSILEMTYTYWPYIRTPAVRWGERPIHPIDFFECKDGWIFVLCVEEEQWQRFVQLMDSPEWASWEVFANRFVRAANYDALQPLLADWIKDWTVDDLYRAAQEKRIPFAPVSTMGSLVQSQHLQARGFFVQLQHPRAGRLQHPGAPYKLGGTPWELRSPAPTLGQHNQDVLAGRLGLAADEIASLQEAAVV